MSIAITWVTDAGLDGGTNVSASSKYARSAADDHAYEAETADGAKTDPIGIIAPRASVEKAAADLNVTSLLSTASAQQRTHSTTVDDYLAFNVQVVTENVVADLEGQVMNLVTGVIVEELTFEDIVGNGTSFASQCVMVPTGHAVRVFATGAGSAKVTIVLEPTDDPSDFATLCCCDRGDKEICCNPAISPGSFALAQFDWMTSGTGAKSVGYNGTPDPGHFYTVAACNIDATTVVTVQRDPNFPAPLGTRPVVTQTVFTPGLAPDLPSITIEFDFTGYNVADFWLVQLKNPCGCCATYMIQGVLA